MSHTNHSYTENTSQCTCMQYVLHLMHKKAHTHTVLTLHTPPIHASTCIEMRACTHNELVFNDSVHSCTLIGSEPESTKGVSGRVKIIIAITERERDIIPVTFDIKGNCCSLNPLPN